MCMLKLEYTTQLLKTTDFKILDIHFVTLEMVTEEKKLGIIH